jgi:hypothetical protein
MKLLSITFFAAMALFGIGACERHSFDVTRDLQDHGSPSHTASPAGPGHGETRGAAPAH